MSVLKCCILVL